MIIVKYSNLVIISVYFIMFKDTHRQSSKHRSEPYADQSEVNNFLPRNLYRVTDLERNFTSLCSKP